MVGVGGGDDGGGGSGGGIDSHEVVGGNGRKGW